MKKPALLFSVLGLLALILLAFDMLIGDSFLSPAQIWAALADSAGDPVTREIVLSLRMTRTLVAVLVGAALSVSGLQMQTVFRNPLADPYLLGISSGSALGAALFILGLPLFGAEISGFWQSAGIVGAGWIGAAAVLVCVTAIGRRIKNILGVLVLGVMLSYIIGALIQIMQYMSSAEQLKMFFLWSMGSLGNVTAPQLLVMLPVLLAGFALSVYCIKPLNLLLLGEEYACTMGLDTKRNRTILFFSTSLLAGTVTAFCGPVGFLGLAVPHIARFLFNDADHRILLPGTALTGVIAILVCDMSAKILVLPVNCIAALLGIPVIIWVIFKNLHLP